VERPHPCGRFACILDALLLLSKPGTTKGPIFRLLTQTRLHRIVSIYAMTLAKMPRIPNVTIEVLLSPACKMQALLMAHPLLRKIRSRL
jgi:hypothetical protein